MTTGLTAFKGPFSAPSAVVLAPDGNLWVAGNRPDQVSTLTVVAPDSTVKATFIVPTPGAGVSALAVGPDGNIWFVETNEAIVGKVTPSGVFSEFRLPTAPVDFGFGVFDVRPVLTDIIAGPDGALWVAEAGTNAIGRIATDGSVQSFPLPAGLQPGDLALGSDGLIWFTDTSFHGGIGRRNADGSVSSFPLAQDFSWPQGLTPGPDGALWFAEGTRPVIGRVTADGIITETPIRAGVGVPSSIGFDAAGNAWMTTANTALARLAPDGTLTDLGLAASPADAYHGLTAGPDGTLWFVNSNQDQILRLDPTAVPPGDPSAHILSGYGGFNPNVPVGNLPNSIAGDFATVFDSNAAGKAADYSAPIDWGDGSTSPGVIRDDPTTGSMLVSGGPHAYPVAGTWTLQVTVTAVNPQLTAGAVPLTVSTTVGVGTLGGPADGIASDPYHLLPQPVPIDGVVPIGVPVLRGPMSIPSGESTTGVLTTAPTAPAAPVVAPVVAPVAQATVEPPAGPIMAPVVISVHNIRAELKAFRAMIRQQYLAAHHPAFKPTHHASVPRGPRHHAVHAVVTRAATHKATVSH